MENLFPSNILDHLNEEQLSYFKEKWRQFRTTFHDTDMHHEDKDIIDILDAINEMEGVVTRWSCGGHPVKGNDKRFSRFYIAMTGTERGIGNIRKFLRDLKINIFNSPSYVDKDNRTFNFSLAYIEVVESSLLHPDEGIWYPIIMLRSHFMGHQLRAFRSRIRNVLHIPNK